ncbi:MAG: CopY family transcriptional regulator [Parcubacteria group bacterium]|jgi:predicted transcriptional regulator|nr:CopY family transcriptional regulator [Parcubacteria group bacterium]|tara:strand:- start:18748 stop:19134 length:387 start_codon:yes stop_codon:yes gene_type:complete
MSRKKISQALGDLEADIMEIIWNLESVSVRQVFSRLKKKRKVAYTTVMTVMSRLAEKNVLKRKLDSSGAYIYRAIQDKQTFLAATSKKAINALLSEFGEVAVAQFIDIIESKDIRNANNWRKKLKKVK